MGVESDEIRFGQLEEILPEVGKGLNLSKDPNQYGLMGSSSGAIAAFNAAWERPDKFRRVMSFIGTFVNIPPANARKRQSLPRRQNKSGDCCRAG